MAAPVTMQNTTIKVRLRPTPEQAALFDKTFDCCRYLWNKMLSEQEEFYAATGVHFLPTPAHYKKEAPFLKEVDSQALVSVHQNLRRAFQKFFDQPQVYRHPVFKKKKDRRHSYTIYRSTQSKTLYITRDAVRLPKLGLVKAVFHRRPLHWWTLKSATISKSTAGHYDCSLLFEYPVKQPATVIPTQERTVGLHSCATHFYVDSSGNRTDVPKWLTKSQQKLAAMEKKLSRMEFGSRNYEQQLQKIRRQYEHIANQRKDFIHKQSHRIANEWDAVCVRQSDLKAMAQNPILKRKELGFGQFRICLQYKLARQGKQYLTVEPFFPSSRTCNNCGFVHDPFPRVRKTWHCPGCGSVLIYDTNAARNLKTQGLAQFVDTKKVAYSA